MTRVYLQLQVFVIFGRYKNSSCVARKFPDCPDNSLLMTKPVMQLQRDAALLRDQIFRHGSIAVIRRRLDPFHNI